MCATGGIAGSTIRPCRAPKCMSKPGWRSKCAGPAVRAASRPASAFTPRTATSTASRNSVRCCVVSASGISGHGPISATGSRCFTRPRDPEAPVNDPREPLAIDAHGRGSSPAMGANLRRLFATIRAQSCNLAKPLSEEDCCVQSMPEASPVKWHLAHTTWFFETFVLEKYEEPFAPFLPAFRMLFNSYYNGVGEKHPRVQRGLLTRPALHEVLLYRKKVNERMEKIFARFGDDHAFCALVGLGLHHEQQHQELILTDIKHLLSLNPLKPAYREQEEENSPAVAGIEWLAFDGGLVETGHGGDGFCFDNEAPRHKQYLNPYSLASRLVTNGDFLDFIAEGGYHDPRLWLS